MSHISFWGPTGSGKNNLLNTWVLDWIREGKWITLALPHADTGEKLIAALYHTYGPSIIKRMIVERLSDVDRVIPRTYLRRSTKTGLEGDRENEQYASTFVETLAHQRGKSDLRDNPVLNEYSHLLARVYQAQTVWCPEWYLMHGLDHRHACHKHLLRHCSNPHLASELDSTKFIPQREKINMLYSTSRLFKAVYDKTPIKGRTSHPSTTDSVSCKNNGVIHVILGGDVATEVLRLHIRADFQQTVFDGHRLTRPGYYVFDEVNNYDLWGPFELRCLATVRHLGISMVGLFQSANFPEPENLQTVFSNTTHVWMPQQDFGMGKLASLDCAGMFDRNKVHHVEQIKRQVNKGFREEIRIVKGISKGEHGESESEREQINLVPILGTEIDERPVYEQHDAQTFWGAQDFLDMTIGEAVIRDMRTKPYKIHVPFMKDPWPFGMSAKKVKECIERIKQRPEYVVPEIRYPEPPTTPLGKKGTKKPGRG